MKKIIFMILLFFGFPILGQAADYKITNQYIDAEILANGDLKISELIVMNGSFNGYEKKLNFRNTNLDIDSGNYANNAIYNGSKLELISLKAKKVKSVSWDTFKDSDFEDFSKESYASNGDILKYIESIRGYTGNTYRLYYKANREKVAFLITYLVSDVVVVHNDVAELYWNFISPNDYDDMNDVKVMVRLPGTDNSEDFRVWAHGNLAGNVFKNSLNTGVDASIDYMESSALLDIRLTFNKSLITDTSRVKVNNDTVLNKMIEVETERAEVANNLRKELLEKYNFVKYSTIIYELMMIILGVGIYYKYGKSPKSTYYSKYNREFIEDYNVEVVDYLMNKSITPNAMSASIMNLIYKKNISVTEIIDEKGQKDYKFHLENRDNINESEKILIDFLFNKVGNKEDFTNKELKTYASGKKTCDSLIFSYTKWKTNVIDIGKKEKFFEKSGVPVIISAIVFFIGFFLFINGIIMGVDFWLLYLLPIFLIVFLLFGILIDKKTVKGIEHYTRWKAFKNFLEDFGSFELKVLPEIILWERYLVYATVFGIAKKVNKSMNVRIEELELDNNYVYAPNYYYFNLSDTINTSINSAINSAYSRQAANYSNSHSSSSSGSGFGGGFSSGGGFGGGGSSGHGF